MPNILGVEVANIKFNAQNQTYEINTAGGMELALKTKLGGLGVPFKYYHTRNLGHEFDIKKTDVDFFPALNEAIDASMKSISR